MQSAEQKSAYLKEWRARNKDKCKQYAEIRKPKLPNQRRKLAFGINEDSYLNMVKKQEGKCLACLLPSSDLRVDHDHQTGRVRGLLCDPCNRTLGFFQDDPKIISKAKEYLINE